MAGNLLDMGLRLKLGTALVGLRNVRFVSFSLLWCFVLGPAVAYGLTRLIPLEAPYAMGLILIGLAPCAPFMPSMVDRARGDLGYTASFMLLASVGMVAYMPLAVPLLVDGLSVSAWVIAKPLLAVVLVPLVIGMVTLRRAPAFADAGRNRSSRRSPEWPRSSCSGCAWSSMARPSSGRPAATPRSRRSSSTPSSPAAAYRWPSGCRRTRRACWRWRLHAQPRRGVRAVVRGVGPDERAIVMVALGVPLQTIAAVVAARVFGARAEKAGT